MDPASRSFRNITLSYRGSERQAPSSLQLALRMSHVMELRQQDGQHPVGWTCEERLKAVVAEFHSQPGLNAKHFIDDDRFRTIYHLISGTSEAAREVIRQHLNHNKWQQSAFSVDQFKSARWLLGSSPKMATCPMKKALAVTEESQVLHLKLVVKSFVEEGRKLRASSRSKKRLSSDQFDRFCDFACIYAAVISEARLLSTWSPEKEQEIKKLCMQKCLGCSLSFVSAQGLLF